MNILVVYYSNSGNTKSVAEAVAAKCSGDIESIADLKKRQGGFAYLLAAIGSFLRQETQIKGPEKNPDQYELVVLGTPVWSWNLTPAMRSYIRQQSDNFSRVAFFCTEGGAGEERVFKQMAELCGEQPIATLAIKEQEIKSGTHSQKIEAFVSTLLSPARN